MGNDKNIPKLGRDHECTTVLLHVNYISIKLLNKNSIKTQGYKELVKSPMEKSVKKGNRRYIRLIW